MKINIHSFSLSVCVALGMGLSLSLASCSEEDTNAPVAEDDSSLAVHFTAPSQSGWGATRAADAAWADGDGIGIRMEPSSGTAAYHCYNYSESNNKFTPASAADTFYYPVDGSEVQFAAFYPYSADVTNEVAFDVTNQSTEAAVAAVDFMYSALTTGTYNKNSTDHVALNEFTHLLSKLTIEVTTPDGATAVDLTNLSVTLNGVPSGYTVALSDGSLGIESTPGTSVTAPHATNSASAASFHLMVVPHVCSDKDYAFTERNLTFTLGENTYTYWLPLDAEFKSGEAYTFAFVLSNDGEVVLEVKK